MSPPDPFPPLRVNATDARASVEKRRREGADLFQNDTRYTSDMYDRFEAWYQGTATDLERMFWSVDVANWFRQGMWLVGSGNYGGIIETRNDRLRVLDQLLELIPAVPPPSASTPEEFDVCLSFADEQRSFVEEVANRLREANVRVFYDRYEAVDLWGKDLYEHLNKVYRDCARYCVIFISKEYAAKQWTSHERKSAQARAFRESREYILPARFDDTELPGLNDTVGYVDLRQTSPAKLADMVIRKIGLTPAQGNSRPTPVAPATVIDSGLHPTAPVSLVAEWKRRDVHIELHRHDYRLLIDLHNTRSKRVDEWRIQVWFPNAFVSDSKEKSGHKLFEEYGSSDRDKRLYPGDRLHVLDIDYVVNHGNWPSGPLVTEDRKREWYVRIRVSADEMQPWETDIPMAELQNF